MKGRIECPNCSKLFDITKLSDKEDMVLSCPYCQHHFNIHPTCKKPSNNNQSEECDWEEHGEPRKTILSSMKPRTDRPMIATFLLMIVVCIGIIAAITPTTLLETPVMIFSTIGSEGSISFHIEDINLTTINQLSYKDLEDNTVYTGSLSNDSFLISNLHLGRRTGEVTINIKNETMVLPLDIYVIPMLSNSYTIFSDENNDIMVTHAGYGWATAILMILSVVCLIGMFTAWRRYHSDVALICSFVGILTIGFFFIGSILSIIAFYLIYQSRDEFDDGKKGKSF